MIVVQVTQAATPALGPIDRSRENTREKVAELGWPADALSQDDYQSATPLHEVSHRPS